jgi:hypothetical protein
VSLEDEYTSSSADHGMCTVLTLPPPLSFDGSPLLLLFFFFFFSSPCFTRQLEPILSVAFAT